MIRIEPAHIRGEGKLGQPLRREYLLFPFVALSLRALNIRHANQAYQGPTYFPRRAHQEAKAAKGRNLMDYASEDLGGYRLFRLQIATWWTHLDHT